MPIKNVSKPEKFVAGFVAPFKRAAIQMQDSIAIAIQRKYRAELRKNTQKFIYSTVLQTS